MKRGIIILLLLLILPLASAEIIISQQPKNVYSLGDLVPVPATVKTITPTTGIFEMNLICNGQETNFYKNGISLNPGEEKRIEASLVLNRNVIGELKGDCTIKAILGPDFVLTNEFRVSDVLTVSAEYTHTEFSPGENILIKGNAVKENGEGANGYVEMAMTQGNDSLFNQKETINNGFFSINTTLPGDMKAGDYIVRLTAYEQDINGDNTNTGFQGQGIYVVQVPTSLEILFDDSDQIEPGTDLKVRAVLHDQTGEKIESTAFLTVRNNRDKIMESVELGTDEVLEYPIVYNEPPARWTVEAESNEITTESTFNITEKEEVDINIFNTTMEITNTGNVPYNDTLLVKIGNSSVNIDVFLEVDETSNYRLTAPDGEYEVEIIADGETTSATLPLTGKAVDVKKASGIGGIIKFPLVWLFMIAILGFVAFIVFKRGYQKSFIGYINSKVRHRHKAAGATHHVIAPDKRASKAELMLSIKGDRQNATLLDVKIKNMMALQHVKEESVEEVLNKVKDLAESHKAALYEDQGNLIFIFAPARTRTFRNEMHALRIAEKIKEELDNHNKLFKHKISYGIALNYGVIVGKQEKEAFKFMAMGNLISQTKRIANIAESEVLLSEAVTDRVRTEVKPTRHEKSGMHVYTIKEVKNKEDHEKFLKSFMKRQDAHHTTHHTHSGEHKDHHSEHHKK